MTRRITRRILGAMNLREAKALVERILDGDQVSLTFDSRAEAERFWAAAERTGVTGRVE